MSTLLFLVVILTSCFRYLCPFKIHENVPLLRVFCFILHIQKYYGAGLYFRVCCEVGVKINLPLWIAYVWATFTVDIGPNPDSVQSHFLSNMNS